MGGGSLLGKANAREMAHGEKGWVYRKTRRTRVRGEKDGKSSRWGGRNRDKMGRDIDESAPWVPGKKRRKF